VQLLSGLSVFAVLVVQAALMLAIPVDAGCGSARLKKKWGRLL
jgi:hypothetical protein